MSHSIVSLSLTFREKKYEAEFSSDGSFLKFNNLELKSITEFCNNVTGTSNTSGQTMDKIIIYLNGKSIAKYADVKLKLTLKGEERLKELYQRVKDPNSLKQLLEKPSFKPSQMVPPPKSDQKEIMNTEEVHVALVLELENLCESLQTTAMLLTYMGTTEDSEDVRQEIKKQRKLTNTTISNIEDKLDLLQNHPQYDKLSNDFGKLKNMREEYFKTKLKQLLEKYPSARSLKNKNQNTNTRKAVKVEKEQLFELLQKPGEGSSPSYSQEDQQLLLQQDELVFVPYQEDEEELKELQRLHKDLRDLYGISQDLHEEVAVQGEKIIQVQSNVDQAELSVKQGTRYLQEAKKIGALSAIVVGGTVGGLILGGPLGAIVGLKAGVALGVSAGVGGLVVGATTGGLLSKFATSMGNSISGAYSKVTAPFMAKKQLASSPPQPRVN